MSVDGLSKNQLTVLMKAQQKKVDQSKRKKYVCVHWIIGQCKFSDDQCDFLHVYDQDKLPPCKFMQQTGSCPNQEKCLYKHEIQTKVNAEVCPYYERGFCRPYLIQDGRNISLIPCNCKYLHNFQRICENYTLGFCPDGPNCSKVHIKSVISDSDSTLKILANFPIHEDWVDFSSQKMQKGKFQKMVKKAICHRCGQQGHKSTYCQEDQIPKEQLKQILQSDFEYYLNHSTMQCFKCNGIGHYADLCPMKNSDSTQQQNFTFDDFAQKIQSSNQHKEIQHDQNHILSQQIEKDECMEDNDDGGHSVVDNKGLLNNLTNLRTLIDKNDQNNQNSLNNNQVVTITGVSLKQLPLDFIQINNSLKDLVGRFGGFKQN